MLEISQQVQDEGMNSSNTEVMNSPVGVPGHGVTLLGPFITVHTSQHIIIPQTTVWGHFTHHQFTWAVYYGSYKPAHHHPAVAFMGCSLSSANREDIRGWGGHPCAALECACVTAINRGKLHKPCPSTHDRLSRFIHDTQQSQHPPVLLSQHRMFWPSIHLPTVP